MMARFERHWLMAILCFVLLPASSAWAKRIDIKWGEIPGAKKYEYQLSRNETFAGDLERSGTTSNLYFVSDLGPGVYFLRVRAVGESSRAGAWSQGTRTVVEATALEIKKPSPKENIEVASETSPFLAEWLAIEGAEDYQVQIKRGKELRTIVSPTNSLRVDGLKAGAWTLSVRARKSGQVIQKSSDVTFNVIINPKPKPIIYSPIAGETAVAWDHFTVRWLNTAASPKSEVVIRRMGDKSGVISREVIYGAAEALTPKLPPGSYQITVRNIYENMTSEAAVVDITTRADAMGYHSQFLGLTAQLTVGPTLGTTGFQNANYQRATMKSGESKHRHAGGEVDLRLIGDLTSQWGFELGAGARGDSFHDELVPLNTNVGFIGVDSSRLQLGALLGARYKLEPLGPSKPIWLRSWIFWRQIEIPTGGTGGIFDVVSSSDPKLSYSNARVFGTGFGAEMRWGNYRSRWDVLGRLDMLVPWISRGLMLGTGGVSPIWPSLELRIVPRVKISTETRLGISLGGRLERITLKEKSGLNSVYLSNRFFLMPTLSWDL